MSKIYKELCSEKDIAAFDKGRYATRTGFGRRPAVLVVDMTQGFISEKSLMGTGTPGRDAAANIAKLLKRAREKLLPIFYTIISKEILKNPCIGSVGRKRIGPVREMLRDPENSKIPDIIAPVEDELIIEKTGSSAFFGTNLIRMLIYHSIDTLIVAGAATSGCVRATVVDAASYNYYVVVPKECVVDISEASHKQALIEMDMRYSDVLDLGEVLRYIDNLSLER